MKIKPEHYAHMKEAIATIGADNVAIHKQFIVMEGRAKDVAMRLRWDLSYKVQLTKFICDNVYSYADDSHVDTALRAIMREVYPCV